jgi:hypothetical protein
MDEPPYKIQIKLGDAEFAGEGPESTVKDAFNRFLEILAARSVAVPVPVGQTKPQNSVDPAPSVEEIDPALLEKVFVREDDIISLRHLPDSQNKAADAAVLILYGSRRLLQLDDVPVTKLNEGLRRSGISVDRIDRYIGVHSALVRKGGQRSGGRYTLNNQGIRQAETWLKSWLD